MPLPLPSQYDDWRLFSDALIAALTESGGEVVAGGEGSTGGGISYIPPGYTPLWLNLGLGDLYSGNVYGSAPTAPDIVFIDTQNIADAAIETAKIDVGAVGSLQLANLAVVTAKIADAAIVTAKIGDLQVVNAKIGDLAVNNAKIANAAVDSANIVDAAINNAKIGALAVGTANIIDLAVVQAKIGLLAVGAAQIANATITTAKIGNAQITNALIANLAVGTANIIDLNVTQAKIALLAVGAAQIANLAVGSAQIANLAVGTGQIANLAVTTGKIANLAVDTAQLADAAIQNAKIETAAVDTLKIAGATITVPHVSSGGDVFIPGDGSSQTVLTSGNVTVGDGTYGVGLVTVHGWQDGTDDSGVEVTLQTSNNGGGSWTTRQIIKAGTRTDGGATDGYIPFSTAFTVSGTSTLMARILAKSTLVGGASGMNSSYVRDPVIVIQGGKR